MMGLGLLCVCGEGLAPGRLASVGVVETQRYEKTPCNGSDSRGNKSHMECKGRCHDLKSYERYKGTSYSQLVRLFFIDLQIIKRWLYKLWWKPLPCFPYDSSPIWTCFTMTNKECSCLHINSFLSVRCREGPEGRKST